MDSLSTIDTHNDPLLKAALDIATMVHKNQVRKGGSARPYMTHIFTVYHILDKMGASREQKAIGIMHDVIEDCGKSDYPQFADPEMLRQAFLEKLVEYTQPSDPEENAVLENLSHYVVDGVAELSNGSTLYEGKRTWQVEHAASLSHHIKPIKICDQAASVCDGILYSSPETLPMEKAFALKGLDVSRACATVDAPEFHALYKQIFTKSRRYTNLMKAGKVDEALQVRDAFNLDEEINIALLPPTVSEQKEPQIVHHYHNRKHYQRGIARVTLAQETGQVVGFGLVVAPHSDLHTTSNKVADALRVHIEEGDFTRVATKGLEVHRGVHVRDFKVKPPLELGVFLSMARAAEATTWSFASMLETSYRMNQYKTVTRQ